MRQLGNGLDDHPQTGAHLCPGLLHIGIDGLGRLESRHMDEGDGRLMRERRGLQQRIIERGVAKIAPRIGRDRGRDARLFQPPEQQRRRHGRGKHGRAAAPDIAAPGQEAVAIGMAARCVEGAGFDLEARRLGRDAEMHDGVGPQIPDQASRAFGRLDPGRREKAGVKDDAQMAEARVVAHRGDQRRRCVERLARKRTEARDKQPRAQVLAGPDFRRMAAGYGHLSVTSPAPECGEAHDGAPLARVGRDASHTPVRIRAKPPKW